MLELEIELDKKRTVLNFAQVNTEDDLIDIVTKMIDFLGRSSIFANKVQYKDDSYFNGLISWFCAVLWEEKNNYSSWINSLKSLIGEYSIPIMTIHKSKGLEYDAVMFLGLEDRLFWNFKKQKEEDTCAFFVAMSRAKEKLVFTSSAIRNGDFKNIFDNIEEYYKILDDSNLVNFFYRITKEKEGN